MSTPAGWYPDPAGGTGQRYFDGSTWTDQTAPPPGYFNAPPPIAPPSPVPQQKKPGGCLKAVVSFVVLVIVIIALASMCSSTDTKSSSTSSSTASTSAQTGAPSVGATLGDEVRDGKFAFVVNSVTTSDSTYGMSTPRGQWIMVTLSVTNTGNEPQSFFVQNQKLIDAQGREYAADTMAAMSINSEDAMIINMNPGFSAKVTIPFDVPPGTDPESVQLHDSAFSGGVTVHV